MPPKIKLMSQTRIAIDIGSTVIKIAQIGSDDGIIKQDFHPRNFEIGIAKQVESLVDLIDASYDKNKIQICSSANGGLRVGIICLTLLFSGAVLRDQVLLAGANPVFVHDMEEEKSNLNYVDILLVGGGIDCENFTFIEERLKRINPDKYQFGSLVYAGNCYLVDLFIQLFPNAKIVANPLGNKLRSQINSVFEALRHAYIDDLVYKDGISELRDSLSETIYPTPEIVNRGFQRIVFNQSTILSTGACVLIDIGGATTDLHYTVEIIHDDNEEKLSSGASITRYVFPDLGIISSANSTLLQIRAHPRLYEFLKTILIKDLNISEIYQSLREGDYDPSPTLLSYACFFLALDRFSQGHGAGLPVAKLEKVAQFILTGGSAQNLDDKIASKVVDLFFSGDNNSPRILIDRHYQIWIDGITWAHLSS